MYRTYSYNDMPIPVQRRNEDMRKPMPPPKKEIECKEEKIEKKCEKNDNGGILSGIGTDDLILIVVALVLLIDDCDDKLLLIALAFIFLSEWF